MKRHQDQLILGSPNPALAEKTVYQPVFPASIVTLPPTVGESILVGAIHTVAAPSPGRVAAPTYANVQPSPSHVLHRSERHSRPPVCLICRDCTFLGGRGV